MVELPPPPPDNSSVHWQVPSEAWLSDFTGIKPNADLQQGPDLCSSADWECTISPDGTTLYMDDVNDSRDPYPYQIEGEFVIVRGNKLVMSKFIDRVNGSPTSNSSPTETPTIAVVPTTAPENIQSETIPVSTSVAIPVTPNSEPLPSEERDKEINNFIMNLPAPVQRVGAWGSLIAMGIGAIWGIGKVIEDAKDLFSPEPAKGPYGVINPRDGKWYSKEDWKKKKETGSKGHVDNEPDADTVTWLNGLRTRQDFNDKQEAYKNELEKFNKQHGTNHSLDELGFDRVDDLLSEARARAIEEEFINAYAARDARLEWLRDIGFSAMEKIKGILNEGEGNEIEKQKDTKPNGGLWDRVLGITDLPDDNPKN